MRQQLPKREQKPNYALADFVAPLGEAEDYLGGFAVTAGIGEAQLAEELRAQQDDYSAILTKALCDRLAEAFAENMHARVRKEFWGYAPDEKLLREDLIKEAYDGIRPAPGYPAQPDHTEKRTLFDLLDVERQTGILLTESYAMFPASSVSGLYFSHPKSLYFGLGSISKEQVADYAKRKNMPFEETERWLAPILDYIP